MVEHTHSPPLGPRTRRRLLAALSAAHGRLTHSCVAGARRFAQCFRGFQCILPQFARCWRLVQRSLQMGQMVYCPCLDEIDLSSCSASEQARVRQVLTGQCPAFGVCQDNPTLTPSCDALMANAAVMANGGCDLDISLLMPGENTTVGQFHLRDGFFCPDSCGMC